MLQAVFFDFDGVIADTEPLHLRAYQEVLSAERIELSKPDYYARYLGYDDVGLFRALAGDRGIAVSNEQVDAWVDAKAQIVERMLSSDAILFPGASDCVRRFADRVPLAVASGALEPEIERVLRQARLRECFAAIASASDGVRGKPAPDLYLLAVAKLTQHMPGSLDPAKCLAIEDSHWGVEAAKRAGLKCVAVTHTYPAAELGQADLVVGRLADLTPASVSDIVRDNGLVR
jgi:beta-phosphoglucomutase-like phosphatase (HAD superfamily)